MSSPDASPPSNTPSPASLAAKLKAQLAAGADPSVPLETDPADVPVGATQDLLDRLTDHRTVASRYQLRGEIARGGMGAILEVWDEDLRRKLAMKVVLGKTDPREPGSTPTVDPRSLGRFLEEAQVTGQLDHPGIAPVHELGLDSEGRVYFTMKLVKGRDLKHIFDLVFEGKEGWNETRALSVMLKVCEAMAYAHSKGVIHRDLKPANVMVGSFGEVYVMDWGLARVLGRKDSHDIRLKPDFTVSMASVKTERRDEREDAPDSPLVTMDGDVMGTPAYMPPEQAQGEIERLSSRSDVYAIGAMIYHLLTRQMPYVKPGARVSNRTVLAMVLNGPPAPLSSIRKDVPAELAAICEKAMAREAEGRYPDTLALAEDLRAFLEHRVVSAYETGAWAEAKKWVERNRPLAVALAGGVIALVGGLLVSLSLRAEAKRQASIAEASLEDVLRLSAVVDLPDQLGSLIRRAGELWPATPENVPKYEAWLADAKTLLEGRAADEAQGTTAKLGLADQIRKLEEVDARAVPMTEEEREAERRAHPRAAELVEKKARLAWLARMLGHQPRPSEESVEAALASEALPADANELNRLAWELVDPNSRTPGDEVRGLLLARRAIDAAPPEEQSSSRDTLAWALYRNGRFDEALSEESRAADEAPAARREEFAEYLERLTIEVDSWQTASGHAQHVADYEYLSAETPELAREVSRRHSWDFERRDDRMWHQALSRLVEDLRAFSDPETGLCSSGITAEHGWAIGKRLELARTIEERSVSGPEAKKRWTEAIASIRDRVRCPHYAGLQIEPVLGLLPIGRDPASGLWEFAHLASGDAAARTTEGGLALEEAGGLAFVLVPGGTFRMGAQADEPTGENFDPNAGQDETPILEVALDPCFLSKYEMTQAQWERLTGKNPSLYTPRNREPQWDVLGRTSMLLHPVEQVSWEECMETLSRFGMTLPTEAQWEYACRAGTRTVYWCGDEVESLEGVANVSDRYGKTHGNKHYPSWDDSIDDGQTVHAQVGTYRANPFGLLDMHGNVWEWCLDSQGGYALPVKPGSGEREVVEAATLSARTRVFRGGSFAGTGLYARSAVRRFDLPTRRGSGIGFRPAITLPSR